MKKYISHIIILSICFSIASCSTKQKVIIYGNPGTGIYNSNYKKLGTIQENGKIKIKINTVDYFPYLLSRDNSSRDFIPFAIDYKYKNYDTQHVIGACLIPTGIGALLLIGNMNDNHQYSYKYLSTQKTNDDFMFSAYQNTGEKRTLGVRNTVINNKNTATTSSSSIAKSRTSKSTKTLKNYGKTLAGTYIGAGKLLQNESVIESYTNMKVTLKRVDNNTVTVEVIDNNGEEFFSSSSKYNISKSDNGGYVLHLEGIPSARISINNNTLSYYHPKVNIDGEIYTLEISASRK